MNCVGREGRLVDRHVVQHLGGARSRQWRDACGMRRLTEHLGQSSARRRGVDVFALHNDPRGILVLWVKGAGLARRVLHHALALSVVIVATFDAGGVEATPLGTRRQAGGSAPVLLALEAGEERESFRVAAAPMLDGALLDRVAGALQRTMLPDDGACEGVISALVHAFAAPAFADGRVFLALAFFRLHICVSEWNKIYVDYRFKFGNAFGQSAGEEINTFGSLGFSIDCQLDF